MPTHFQYADKIYLHYSTSIKDDYAACATIDLVQKEITIHHQDKYNLFARQYDEKRKADAPSWATLIKDIKF